MKIENRIKRFKFATLILSFIFFGLHGIDYSQNTKPDENKQTGDQEDALLIDTNLVTVPVSVSDRDGRYVANLKKEDFRIFEDGVEQEIALFEPTDQPFTVLILLNNGGSMTPYLPEMVDAANAFVGQLRADDSVIAATFAGKGIIKVLFKATKVSVLKKDNKIRVRKGDGAATTYDAVDFGLDKMEKIAGRKAIILFTDPELGGLYSTAEENLDDAEENEALIYTIRFGSLPTNFPPNFSPNLKKIYLKMYEKNYAYLRDLAVKTGGRAFQIEDIANLEETFKKIAEELGQQYSLGHYPKREEKNGERRQIRVKVKQPNLAVRARDSYIAESPKK